MQTSVSVLLGLLDMYTASRKRRAGTDLKRRHFATTISIFVIRRTGVTASFYATLSKEAVLMVALLTVHTVANIVASKNSLGRCSRLDCLVTLREGSRNLTSSGLKELSPEKDLSIAMRICLIAAELPHCQIHDIHNAALIFCFQITKVLCVLTVSFESY